MLTIVYNFIRGFHCQRGRFHRTGNVRNHFIGAGQPRECELAGSDIRVGNVCDTAHCMLVLNF